MLTTTGGNATATIRGSGGDGAAGRGDSRVRRSSGNHYNFRKGAVVGELEVIAAVVVQRLRNSGVLSGRTVPSRSTCSTETKFTRCVDSAITCKRQIHISISRACTAHWRHVLGAPRVIGVLVVYLHIAGAPLALILRIEVEREVRLGGHVHLQGDGLARTSFLGRDADGA